MIRFLYAGFLSLMLIGSVSLTSLSVAACQELAPSILTWKSGDAIPGQWVQADSDTISWQAESLFRDPVQIDVRYLRQIDFPSKSEPAGNTPDSPATYLVQLVDGGRLYGDITRLDSSHLTLIEERFGELKIRRDRVASLQNLTTAGKWAAGRIDLTQWESARGQKRFWQVNSQGQLVSSRVNIHLYREADLPASALIELELKWNKKLDFIFGLGVPRNARQTDNIPRLESWDDALVFSYGDNFEIVMESYRSDQRRVKLLLHWDQPGQKVAVHSEHGQLLCVADLSELKGREKPGLYIENKTGDLIVSQLIVRQSLPGFDSTKPSYQLVDQPATNGRLIDFDGYQWSIETSEEAEPEAATRVSIPKETFSNAFSLNPPAEEATHHTRIDYSDGMFVSGDVQHYDGQILRLNTNFADWPLELQLTDARQITFQSAAAPENDQEFTHQMYNLAGAMRGRLEAGTQAVGDIIRWRLPGAAQSVPFAAADAKIVLQKRVADRDSVKQWPDTLYFYNRDRIPCRLIGIQDQVVHFESFTQRSQVASSLLKAIDLESAYLHTEITPRDIAWIIQEKSQNAIKVSDEEFSLEDTAILSHPHLLTTGGFEFEFQWQPSTYGMMELNLFCDPRLNRSGGTSVQMMFYDSNVMVTSQGEPSNRGSVNAGGKARIRIRSEGQTVKVEVNDRPIHEVTLATQSQRGRGATLTVKKVTDTKFVGRMSQVRHVIPQDGVGNVRASSDQMELMLTIPRLRKNNPPQHILRAVNGDMLRGEIVAMDQETIQFTANHEMMRFPRALVSSLIWLHYKEVPSNGVELNANERPMPADTGNLSDQQSIEAIETNGLRQTVQVVVEGDRRLTYDLSAWRDDQLVGLSTALGECSIPIEQIDELRFGSFANQALDVPYSDWVARPAADPNIMTGIEGDSRSGRLFGSYSPLIGTTLGGLAIPIMDGETFGLPAASGKVVVLDFWATWCSPCVKAMPELIAATDQFSSDDVVLIAVNQEEDVATIRSFLSSREWKVQVGLDNGSLSRRFQVQSLPQTIVIGPDGKVAFVKVGYSNDLRETLQQAISSLIEE